MIIKQDFSNPLANEIEKLENSLGIIGEEIIIRENLPPGTVLEVCLNKKEIDRLRNEVRSKKEFLLKLTEKKILDDAETEEDYLDFVNNIESIKERVIEIEDESDKLRAVYLLAELNLWQSRDHKEACVFYVKALKYLFLEAKITL